MNLCLFVMIADRAKCSYESDVNRIIFIENEPIGLRYWELKIKSNWVLFVILCFVELILKVKSNKHVAATFLMVIKIELKICARCYLRLIMNGMQRNWKIYNKRHRQFIDPLENYKMAGFRWAYNYFIIYSSDKFQMDLRNIWRT